MKDLSLISLELPKGNKNLSKFSQQWQTNNIPFQGYRGKTLSFKNSTTKQNFLELPSVLYFKMVPSKNHSQHTWKPGQQQHQNKYHSFKDTEVKLCHSKIVPPSKISLSYPQCFIVSRVHSFVRAMFPTNPVSQLSLAGRIKFFYSNLTKLTQDLNILNIA